MDAFAQAWAWLTDPVNWSGTNGIPLRLFEHIQMTAYSVLAAFLVAFPIGLYVGHRRRFEYIVVATGNLGRALPSFGILAFFFGIPFIATLPGEIGFWPTLIALFFLAVPPILTNTYVGIKGVDADTLEAARGMGMTESEVIKRLEVPLGAPLIVGGIRTAAVQVVATATLGALGGWGGLGRYIIDASRTRDAGELLGGAILVALLAILTELALGVFERVVSPRTARGGKKRFGWGRLRPATQPTA